MSSVGCEYCLSGEHYCPKCKTALEITFKNGKIVLVSPELTQELLEDLERRKVLDK